LHTGLYNIVVPPQIEIGEPQRVIADLMVAETQVFVFSDR